MKKFIALMLLTSFVMFGTYSCKKYEEGPMISLRSKKSRLDGEWKIDKATQDGIDVTANLPEMVMTLEKDGGFKMLNNATELLGTWEFDDKKENLLIKYDGSTDVAKLKIIRLKNDELWLDETAGTQTIRYYWVPN